MPDYGPLASYLAEGITWRRLRAIGTKPPEEGGLALFADGSPECHRIFHQAPPTIVQTRPQTDMEFLKFLRGKEETLHRLCLQDLRQRKLSEKTQKAVASLAFVTQNIQRSILAEILHRTHYLMFWNQRHPHLALESTMESVMARASEIILDLSIDNDTLMRFQTSQEHLDAEGWQPKSWVELLVLLVVRDRPSAEARLQEALEFHREMSDKASAHLQLIAENLTRTHWQAAALLHKNAEAAQAAAQSLMRHIASTSPQNRSLFEHYLFEDDLKWTELVQFARARPAVRLWHGRGAFGNLFKWLATLFLVSPDHVLDCERVHARWQWLVAQRRSLLLPSLNAILKVTHYLDRHDGNLPPHDNLQPHLEAAAQEFNWDLGRIQDDENIARGWRHQMLFRDRFNLGAEDFNLVMNNRPNPGSSAMTFKAGQGLSGSLHIPPL